MEGQLACGSAHGPCGDEALCLDWPELEGLPHPNGLPALIREAGQQAFTHGSVEDGTLSADQAERRGLYASLAERVQLDLEEHGEALQKELHELTGMATVPSVWIDGQFIGGYTELSRVPETELRRMLDEAGALGGE